MRFFKTRQFYMLQRVASFLEKKKDALFVHTPVLKKLIPEYLKRFNIIHQTVIGKMKPTQIETSEKRDAKTGLMNISLDLVDVIRSYYSDDSGKEMPPEASYTFSDLNRATIETFPKICRQIIDTAKNVPDLRDYGLSAGDVKEAEAYLAEYTAVKKAPRLRKEELAQNNALINEHIQHCILFLENKLDPVMRIATKHNRELNLGYFSFRKVLPRGAGNIDEKEKKYRTSRKKAKVKAKTKKPPKK
jgi:hypothetical protein